MLSANNGTVIISFWAVPSEFNALAPILKSPRVDVNEPPRIKVQSTSPTPDWIVKISPGCKDPNPPAFWKLSPVITPLSTEVISISVVVSTPFLNTSTVGWTVNPVPPFLISSSSVLPER